MFSEGAWQEQEAVSGILATPGNESLCSGGHKPLGAAFKRFMDHSKWTSPELLTPASLLGLQEGLLNGEMQFRNCFYLAPAFPGILKHCT